MYFKEMLKNTDGPILAVVKTVGPLTKTRNGDKEMYPVTWKLTATGNEHEESLFPNTVKYEFGGTIPPVGTSVEVGLNDKGYVTYSVKANGAPPSISNSASVKHERQAVEASSKKSDQICLQGFMQAHIAAGKDNKEALQLAVDAKDKLFLFLEVGTLPVAPVPTTKIEDVPFEGSEAPPQ